MSSYVITGAAGGLGFEFLRQLSEDPKAIVIGLSRNKKATEEKVKTEINRPNIHILQADAADRVALQQAADDTSKITGGKIEYVIANAATTSPVSGEITEYLNLGTLYVVPQQTHSNVSNWELNLKLMPESVSRGNTPDIMEQELLDKFKVNAIGPIHLFNAFMPLLKNGSAKKAIAISTGMADAELVSKFELDISPSYAISKAALNMAVAKFDAQYRKEGVLFLAISPGLVETGKSATLTEEQQQGAMAMVAKFAEYAPDWKGAITPEVSVKAVMSVINNASIENGDGGSFISHWGNKQWL